MYRLSSIALAVGFVGILSVSATALAQDSGQADLDKATELKLSARSMADLEQVIKLCESALETGLDEGNTAFAKQLLTSTLYQHAERICQAIFDRQPPSPRWPLLRRFAMQDLDKALAHDDKLADAHLLVARLQALPEGDRAKASKSAAAAVELLNDDPRRKAKALVIRAMLAEDAETRMADFAEAIRLDPDNVDAWRARGLLQLLQGDNEAALADMLEIIERQPENVVARRAAAESLANLERFDEALEHLNKAIELQPDAAAGYTLRARLHAQAENTDAAIEDLDRAVKIEPEDIAALLFRAQVRLERDELELARGDVDRVLRIQPALPQAFLLRSIISASEEKYTEAIDDVNKLLRFDPKNAQLRLQLGTYLMGDQRPRKAIEVFSGILEDEPDNWMAMRSRGDALLNVGKHAEALKDYEAALKVEPENSGVLNNLAWVLATSPEDELRDGKRSIELGTKACEVTEYKAGHILSTLAAGYAETGDFETALKWSQKAVELGKEDDLEQLKNEVESYKQKKPWREKQEQEEKPEAEKPKPEDLQV